MFSAGFDHEIFVWNPYIDTPVFRVSEVNSHSAPIVSLYAIDHSPQLLSTDSDGILKVWDIRTFECMQTINVEENFEQAKFNLSSMLYLPNHKRMMIAGRKLMFFDYDKNPNPHLADDQTPLCCAFLSKTQELVTPVADSIKTWSALNGCVKRVYGDLLKLPNTELTAFAFDLHQKRFVLGDSKGGLRVFNLVSGEPMKQLKSHDAEVIKILTFRTKEMAFIVSVGKDNLVQVHEDDSLFLSTVRRTIHITSNLLDIRYAELYFSLTGPIYLLLGLNKGMLKSYEVETGRPDGSFSAHSQDTDVNCILALTKRRLFFSANDTGQVVLWQGPQNYAKYQ